MASEDTIDSSAPAHSLMLVLNIFVVVLCAESLRSSKLKNAVSQSDD